MLSEILLIVAFSGCLFIVIFVLLRMLALGDAQNE